MFKVNHITRRTALALGIIPVTPDPSAGTPVTVTPVAGAGESASDADGYTPEVARDFARIWLAGGESAARMRAFARRHGTRQAAMRADAAERLEAEGFDAAAYAAELGITGGAR